MTDREVMQQALKALDKLSKLGNGNQDGNSLGNTIAQEAREHLFTALEQPEQEPVAWMYTSRLAGNQQYITRFQHDLTTYKADKVWALYTTPPAAQRKPLTDEEAHKTLLGMAEHIETFGDANTTDQQLSAECIRFILDQVAAHGIEEGT